MHVLVLYGFNYVVRLYVESHVMNSSLTSVFARLVQLAIRIRTWRPML
jgi:hypothetical protein